MGMGPLLLRLISSFRSGLKVEGFSRQGLIGEAFRDSGYRMKVKCMGSSEGTRIQGYSLQGIRI